MPALHAVCLQYLSRICDVINSCSYIPLGRFQIFLCELLYELDCYSSVSKFITCWPVFGDWMIEYCDCNILQVFLGKLFRSALFESALVSRIFLESNLMDRFIIFYTTHSLRTVLHANLVDFAFLIYSHHLSAFTSLPQWPDFWRIVQSHISLPSYAL